MTTTTVQRGDWGATWVQDEPMRRSSQALASDGAVWLVDPVDDEAGLAAADELGSVAGVVQLLDRHNRDCSALAERYGVPLHKLPDGLAGTPFQLRRMVWLPVWKEQALWWPDRRLLLVSEAVGTIPYFAVHGGTVGMHPFLRGRPPGALRELAAREPATLLTGHGPAVTDGVGRGLAEALRRSRRDIPKAAVALVKAFAPKRR